MSTLTDTQIRRAIANGNIRLNPYNSGQLNPCSYDVRLGQKLRLYDTRLQSIVDVTRHEPKTTLVTLDPGEVIDLPPGGFALGETVELVALDDATLARFEGKSTLGRYGLMTHVTAGFIDPGFAGSITLELHNVSPVTLRLRAGQRIGQLAFEQLSEACAMPYWETGRYQGQTGPTPPKPLRD